MRLVEPKRLPLDDGLLGELLRLGELKLLEEWLEWLRLAEWLEWLIPPPARPPPPVLPMDDLLSVDEMINVADAVSHCSISFPCVPVMCQ